MRLSRWVGALAIASSGCIAMVRPDPVVVTPPPPQPPPPAAGVTRTVFRYSGPHHVPDAWGGGWCDIEEGHDHEYAPDDIRSYRYEAGVYIYAAPVVVAFLDAHPDNRGGWCYLHGPHTHNYYPARHYREHITWDRDHRSYVYRPPHNSPAHEAPRLHGAEPARPSIYGAPATGSPVHEERPGSPEHPAAAGRPTVGSPARDEGVPVHGDRHADPGRPGEKHGRDHAPDGNDSQGRPDDRHRRNALADEDEHGSADSRDDGRHGRADGSRPGSGRENRPGADSVTASSSRSGRPSVGNPPKSSPSGKKEKKDDKDRAHRQNDPPGR